MGLDQFVYKTKYIIGVPVDFDRRAIDDAEEAFYWRKHPDLHGWMGKLYFQKGGRASNSGYATRYGDFKGPLQLTLDDINQLEFDMSCDDLPRTGGIFFGESDLDDEERTYEFIEIARQYLNDGYSLFYSASW